MPEVNLNFRLVGSGKPLLLVHGFGISFNIWNGLAPVLSPHFNLIMPELPGIGASRMIGEGEDYLGACIAGLEGLRRSLGIPNWSVLGYSTGSRIAEAYVRAQAEHVSSAIFLCPLSIGESKKRLLHIGLWLDQHNPAFGDWVLSGWRLKFLITWLGFNLRGEPLRDDWYAEIGAVPVRVLKETIRAVAIAAERDFSVPVPYAMVWGDRDIVPCRPRRPGQHDFFVHGRHAAPLEAAQEVAQVLSSVAARNKVADQPGDP